MVNEKLLHALAVQSRETNLALMLRCFMAMERWSMRKLAPKIGISAATLHRVCSGYAMDADTLMKILNWMVSSKADTEGKS